MLYATFKKPTSLPNMIPTIDILFQLVIFFMLACQFAVMEQFPIPLPDNCASAAVNAKNDNTLAVTLLPSKDKDKFALAVGSEKIATGDGKELADLLLTALDKRIAGVPNTEMVVSLRLPKDMPFEHAKYILEAIAQSPATGVRMAVLRETDPGY